MLIWYADKPVIAWAKKNRNTFDSVIKKVFPERVIRVGGKVYEFKEMELREQTKYTYGFYLIRSGIGIGTVSDNCSLDYAVKMELLRRFCRSGSMLES